MTQSVTFEIRTRKALYADDPMPLQLVQSQVRFGQFAHFEIIGYWADLDA